MSPESNLRIGIIGDYRPGNTSHVATDAALRHAAQSLGAIANVSWLPTGSLVSSLQAIDSFDGLLGAPGSPYASMAGALAAIRHARENDRVFLGTCGGFQHAVIEFARNVLRIPEAEHEETSPDASTLFISRLSCSLVAKSRRIRIKPGTRLGRSYGAEESVEQFWCNFGVNPEFADPLERSGLRISATDDERNIRAVELPGHRFFIGTLFIPQLSSMPAKPHPVMLAFLKAAANNRDAKSGTQVSGNPPPTTHHGPNS
jgi:CTP synthase (UTP-ammonia lyase)